MAFLAWNNDYNVGNLVIDNQHKKLFQLINDLHEAMKAGKSKDIMNNILNELVSYTLNHFSLEENLMQKNKYPDLSDHKKKHAEFTNKVNDFKKKYTSESSALSIEVLNFLKDWLVYHIKGTDKLYVPFITAK